MVPTPSEDGPPPAPAVQLWLERDQAALVLEEVDVRPGVRVRHLRARLPWSKPPQEGLLQPGRFRNQAPTGADISFSVDLRPVHPRSVGPWSAGGPPLLGGCGRHLHALAETTSPEGRHGWTLWPIRPHMVSGRLELVAEPGGSWTLDRAGRIAPMRGEDTPGPWRAPPAAGFLLASPRVAVFEVATVATAALARAGHRAPVGPVRVSERFFVSGGRLEVGRAPDGTARDTPARVELQEPLEIIALLQDALDTLVRGDHHRARRLLSQHGLDGWGPLLCGVACRAFEPHRPKAAREVARAWTRWSRHDPAARAAWARIELAHGPTSDVDRRLARRAAAADPELRARLSAARVFLALERGADPKAAAEDLAAAMAPPGLSPSTVARCELAAAAADLAVGDYDDAAERLLRAFSAKPPPAAPPRLLRRILAVLPTVPSLARLLHSLPLLSELVAASQCHEDLDVLIDALGPSPSAAQANRLAAADPPVLERSAERVARLVLSAGADPQPLAPFVETFAEPTRSDVLAALVELHVEKAALDEAQEFARRLSPEAAKRHRLSLRTLALALLGADRADDAWRTLTPALQPWDDLPADLVHLALARMSSPPPALLARAEALGVVTDGYARRHIERASALPPCEGIPILWQWFLRLPPRSEARTFARGKVAAAMTAAPEAAAFVATQPDAVDRLGAPPARPVPPSHATAVAEALHAIGAPCKAVEFVLAAHGHRDGEDTAGWSPVLRAAARWALEHGMYDAARTALNRDRGESALEEHLDLRLQLALATQGDPAEVLAALERTCASPRAWALRLERVRAERPEAVTACLHAALRAVRLPDDPRARTEDWALTLADAACRHARELRQDAPAALVRILGWHCPLAEDVAWPSPRAEVAAHLVDVLVHLGRIDEALRVGCRALVHLQNDAGPLCEALTSATERATGAVVQFSPVVEAIASLPAGPMRDTWALRLARVTIAHADAGATLRLFDVVGSHEAIDPDLAEGYAWAVREVGEENATRARLLRELAVPSRAGVAARKLAALYPDGATLGRHLRQVVHDLGSAFPKRRQDLLDLLEECLPAEAFAELLCSLIVHRSDDAWHPWIERQVARLERLDIRIAADLAVEAHRRGLLPPAERSRLLERLARAAWNAPEVAWPHRAMWALAASEADPATASRMLRKLLLDAAPAGDDVPHAAILLGHTSHLDPAQAAEFVRDHALERIADENLCTACLDVLFELGGHRDACDILHRRLDVTSEPEQVPILKRIAHIELDFLGRADRAYEALKAAQAIDDRDPDILLTLLDAAEETGRMEDVVHWTCKALARLPAGPEAASDIAARGLDAAIATMDLDGARAIVRAVEAHHPDAPVLQERRLDIAALAGDPEAKLRLLSRVIDRANGSAATAARLERARLLFQDLQRSDEAVADLKAVLAEDPDHLPALEQLGAIYRAREDWISLAPVLEALAPRQMPADRYSTLRELGRIAWDHLADAPRAERTLRLALDAAEQARAPERELIALTKALAQVLEAQGRIMDAVALCASRLGDPGQALAPDADPAPARIELAVFLAGLYLDGRNDETQAARIYEALAHHDALPEEGWPVLARSFRRRGRNEDLLRMLDRRARALRAAGDRERFADVQQLAAELLEGPLARPHEAAFRWLEAHLQAPWEREHAGRRARVLLSGTPAGVVARTGSAVVAGAPAEAQPFGLALLGDLLSPHEDFEEKALEAYERSLAASPDFEPARWGLGRLYARRGEVRYAWETLRVLARPRGDPRGRLSIQARGEAVALAARVGQNAGDDAAQEAEDLLRKFTESSGPHERVLWELARLYRRRGDTRREERALRELSSLPLSAMMRADVSHRRAVLLLSQAGTPPAADRVEQARSLLADAVAADARHVEARKALADLARSRGDWAVYVQTVYFAIRDLPESTDRARLHAELAEVYARHLEDFESARRNIETALRIAPTDAVVEQHLTGALECIGRPFRAAEAFLRAARSEPSAPSRAAFLLAAARLFARQDDITRAEDAARAAETAVGTKHPLARTARGLLSDLRRLPRKELRRERAGLRRLLEEEEDPAERCGLLLRISDVCESLGDHEQAVGTAMEALGVAVAATRIDEAATAARTLADLSRTEEQRLRTALHLAAVAESNPPPFSARLYTYAAALSVHVPPYRERAARWLSRAALRARDPAAVELLGRWADELPPAAAREIWPILSEVAPEETSHQIARALADLGARAGVPEAADWYARAAVTAPPGEAAVAAHLEAARGYARGRRWPRALEHARMALEKSLSGAPERTETAWEVLDGIAETAGRHAAAFHAAVRCIEAGRCGSSLVRRVAVLGRRLEAWDDLHRALSTVLERATSPSVRAAALAARADLAIDAPFSARAGDPIDAAYRDLVDAMDLDPSSDGIRRALLPVAFQRCDWARVQACAVGLAQQSADPLSLALGAVAVAVLEGRTAWARSFPPLPAEPEARRAFAAAVADALSHLARSGPLAHADAVLQAASHLLGGAHALLGHVRALCRERKVAPGLLLGLGRLEEAGGAPGTARMLYELAAFLSPATPLSRWSRHLPPVRGVSTTPGPAPEDVGLPPLLVSALSHAASARLGLARDVPASNDPKDAQWAAVARQILRSMGADPPPLRMVDALSKPVESTDLPGRPLYVRRELFDEPSPVLQAWLFRGAAARRLGLSGVVDLPPDLLVDLLDGLGFLVDPRHRPGDPRACAIGSRLLAHRRLTEVFGRRPSVRARLADELLSVLSSSQALEWFRDRLDLYVWTHAVQIGGRLDGALAAVAGAALPERADAAQSLLGQERPATLLRLLRLF